MQKTKTSTAKKIQKKNFVSQKFNIGVISPLTSKRNVELFLKSVEPLCELGFSFSVLAVGDKVAQIQCVEFSERFPNNFKILESIPKNHLEILKKSQIVLFTSKPEKDILKNLAQHGVVPVMPNSETFGIFENFDAQQEKGNAFLYDEENYWEFLATVIRAYENFKFPYDWSQLKKSLKKDTENL